MENKKGFGINLFGLMTICGAVTTFISVIGGGTISYLKKKDQLKAFVKAAQAGVDSETLKEMFGNVIGG